jgi:SAM-dependent methyltransferase
MLSRLLAQVRRSLVRNAGRGPSTGPLGHVATSCKLYDLYFGREQCLRRPFFNVGAGKWTHPYWKNVDIIHPRYPQNVPDLVYDITSEDPFPVPEGGARLIYLSHVIEHVNDEFNRRLFENIHRALADGGVVRFVFPDVDLAQRAYEADDRLFFLYDWGRQERNRKVREAFPTSYLLMDFFATRVMETSPVDGVEKMPADEFEDLLRTRPREEVYDLVTARIPLDVQRAAASVHCNWWNVDKLTRFLREAGFDTVERSAYLQSRVQPLRHAKFFDVRHPAMSGYVEAVK